MTVQELDERATAAEVLIWARLEQIDEDHERRRSLERLVKWGRHGGSR